MIEIVDAPATETPICSIINDFCPYDRPCADCGLKWLYDHTKKLSKDLQKEKPLINHSWR